MTTNKYLAAFNTRLTELWSQQDWLFFKLEKLKCVLRRLSTELSNREGIFEFSKNIYILLSY